MSSQIDSDTLPKYLRILMAFIDRVGFPIMAFLILAYICFVSIDGLKTSLNSNTQVLKELKVIICLKTGANMEAR